MHENALGFVWSRASLFEFEPAALGDVEFGSRERQTLRTGFAAEGIFRVVGAIRKKGLDLRDLLFQRLDPCGQLLEFAFLVVAQLLVFDTETRRP